MPERIVVSPSQVSEVTSPTLCDLSGAANGICFNLLGTMSYENTSNKPSYLPAHNSYAASFPADYNDCDHCYPSPILRGALEGFNVSKFLTFIHRNGESGDDSDADSDQWR
jgi:hypothetical protein